MSGPRDWSPAGYWAEPAAPALTRARTRPRPLNGLVAVMLGLGAVFLPVATASRPGYTGWFFTTIGISAIVLAGRYRKSGGSLFLSSVGSILGVLGTVLCVWSLVAFYSPASVPAFPSLQAVAGVAPVAPTGAEGAALPAPSSNVRVVAPFEGANVVPGNQLHANLVHVVFMLGAAMSFEQTQGTLPSALSVRPDGTVTSPGVTYSKLAPYMALSYAVAPGGFALTVKDIPTGMAVGVDPGSNRVVDR